MTFSSRLENVVKAEPVEALLLEAFERALTAFEAAVRLALEVYAGLVTVGEELEATWMDLPLEVKVLTRA